MLLSLQKKPGVLCSILILGLSLFLFKPAAASGNQTPTYNYSQEQITTSKAVSILQSDTNESETELLPEFVQNVLWWTGYMMFWVLLGFGAVFALALIFTGLSEAYWINGLRKDLLDHPDAGGSTVWKAIKLGFASTPSRRRIFIQAKELLAEGVSRAGVLTYLFSAQSILIFILILILEVVGIQLALGQLVAAGAGILVLVWAANHMPDDLWNQARVRARKSLDNSTERDLLFTQMSGSWRQRIWTSIKG